ncbi:MAG: hypothetical protein CO034_01845 [Parcubacteria group bacterium CG_4_9_14_0_2_um_filter_35_11]|nr:MAG: hypothetical protein CO034_01845 [Parcubacteria group bacterium CG_4_9_14_0_2_um_filter_35_11]
MKRRKREGEEGIFTPHRACSGAVAFSSQPPFPVCRRQAFCPARAVRFFARKKVRASSNNC